MPAQQVSGWRVQKVRDRAKVIIDRPNQASSLGSRQDLHYFYAQ